MITVDNGSELASKVLGAWPMPRWSWIHRSSLHGIIMKKSLFGWPWKRLKAIWRGLPHTWDWAGQPCINVGPLRVEKVQTLLIYLMNAFTRVVRKLQKDNVKQFYNYRLYKHLKW